MKPDNVNINKCKSIQSSSAVLKGVHRPMWRDWFSAELWTDDDWWMVNKDGSEVWFR